MIIRCQGCRQNNRVPDTTGAKATVKCGKCQKELSTEIFVYKITGACSDISEFIR